MQTDRVPPGEDEENVPSAEEIGEAPGEASEMGDSLAPKRAWASWRSSSTSGRYWRRMVMSAWPMSRASTQIFMPLRKQLSAKVRQKIWHVQAETPERS